MAHRFDNHPFGNHFPKKPERRHPSHDRHEHDRCHPKPSCEPCRPQRGRC